MIAMDGPTFFGRDLEGALSEGPNPSGGIIALWRSSPLGSQVQYTSFYEHRLN